MTRWCSERARDKSNQSAVSLVVPPPLSLSRARDKTRRQASLLGFKDSRAQIGCEVSRSKTDNDAVHAAPAWKYLLLFIPRGERGIRKFIAPTFCGGARCMKRRAGALSRLYHISLICDFAQLYLHKLIVRPCQIGTALIYVPRLPRARSQGDIHSS